MLHFKNLREIKIWIFKRRPSCFSTKVIVIKKYMNKRYLKCLSIPKKKYSIKSKLFIWLIYFIFFNLIIMRKSDLLTKRIILKKNLQYDFNTSWNMYLIRWFLFRKRFWIHTIWYDDVIDFVLTEAHANVLCVVIRREKYWANSKETCRGWFMNQHVNLIMSNYDHGWGCFGELCFIQASEDCKVIIRQ